MFLEPRPSQPLQRKSVVFQQGNANEVSNSPGTFERPLSRLAHQQQQQSSSSSPGFFLPKTASRGAALAVNEQQVKSHNTNNGDDDNEENHQQDDDHDDVLKQHRTHQQQLRSSLFSFSSSTSALLPCQPPPSQPFRPLDPNWVKQNPQYEKPRYFQPGLRPAGCLSDGAIHKHAHQLDGDMLAMDRALVVETLDALAAAVDEYPDEVGPSFGLTQAVNAKRKNVLNSRGLHHHRSGSSGSSYQSPFLRQQQQQMKNQQPQKSNNIDALEEFSPTTRTTTTTTTTTTTNEPPVYFLSIELEKGKLGSIALRPDSNCAEIARDFALRHDLDEIRVVAPLTKYLQEELRSVLKSLGQDTSNATNLGKQKHADPNEASGIRSYLQKHGATSRNQPSFSRPLKRFVSEDDEEILVEDSDEFGLGDGNDGNDGDDLTQQNINDPSSKKTSTTAIGLLKRATSAKFAYNREARKAIAAAQDAKRIQQQGGHAASIQVKRNAGGTSAFRAKGREDELRLQRELAKKKEEEKRHRMKEFQQSKDQQQRASSANSNRKGGKSQQQQQQGDQLLYAYPVISDFTLRIGNNNFGHHQETTTSNSGHHHHHQQQQHYNIFNHNINQGHNSAIPPRRLNYWEQEIRKADDLLKTGGGTNAALEAERKKKAAIQTLQKRSQRTLDHLLMTGKSTQARMEAQQAKAAAIALIRNGDAAKKINDNNNQDENNNNNEKQKNSSSSAPPPTTESRGQQQRQQTIGDRLYGQALQQSLRLAKLRSEAKHKEEKEIASMSFKPEIHAAPSTSSAPAASSPKSAILSSEEKELKENCTFKPKVDTKSSDMVAHHQHQHQPQGVDFLGRMQQKEQLAADKIEEKRKYLASTDPATGQPYFVPSRK